MVGLTLALLPMNAWAKSKVEVKDQVVKEKLITGSYPQFYGLDDPKVQEQINGEVTKSVKQFIEECRKDKFLKEAKISYELNYLAKNKVSFEVSMYSYSGGAHGMTSVKGYTYDLKSGRQYTFTQLFDYRPSEINKAIFKQSKANDWILFDDFKGIDNYPDNFYLDEKGAPVILFQQYEIAPYSTGIIRVHM